MYSKWRRMATIEGNRSRTETSLLQKVLKIARLQIGIFEIHGSLTKYVIKGIFICKHFRLEFKQRRRPQYY